MLFINLIIKNKLYLIKNKYNLFDAYINFIITLKIIEKNISLIYNYSILKRKILENVLKMCKELFYEEIWCFSNYNNCNNYN